MSGTFKVKCNLLQAEVYARNAELCTACAHNYKNKMYKELRNVQTADGMKQVLVDVPYPVTPESVKSYAASADYRNDVGAAMASPAPGANLGDLTDVQKVLSADMESARELYANLKAVFENAAVQKQENASAAESNVSEVTNNG